MNNSSPDWRDFIDVEDGFEFLLDELESSTETVGDSLRQALDADNMDAVVAMAGLKKQIRSLQVQLQQVQTGWQAIWPKVRELQGPKTERFPAPMSPLQPAGGGAGTRTGVTITNHPRKFYSYTLNGIERTNKHAIRLVVRLLRELHAADPTFLQRYAAHPDHGDKRKLIAKSAEELYASSPHLAEKYAEELVDGWWIGSNYNVRELSRRLQIAQQVSRRPFTFDLGVQANL